MNPSKKSQKKKSWMTVICVLIVAPLFVTIVGGVVVEWMKPTESTSRMLPGNQTTSPPKPRIVGKWQRTEGSPATFEFFPDKTCRIVMSLKTFNGKYLLLDDNRIRLETEGFFWGTDVSVWKFAISGNLLTLTYEGLEHLEDLEAPVLTFTRM